MEKSYTYDDNFSDDMMNHKEPVCPKCGKGKVVCPQGKIKKTHYFECTEQCGWFANIDYNDIFDLLPE